MSCPCGCHDTSTGSLYRTAVLYRDLKSYLSHSVQRLMVAHLMRLDASREI